MGRLHVHKHTRRLNTRTHVMDLLSRSCLVVVVAVVLLVPAARAACTVVDETDPCVPACSICEIGDKVPNPDDCHGYLVCESADDTYDLTFDCDAGEVFVFNTTYQDCVKGDSCTPCPTEPLTCVYECPDMSDATDPVPIPAFSDCSNYYQCEIDGTTLTPMTCDDSEPFFDGAMCQTNETRCCHCHAYCESSLTVPAFIADPLDCRRYYFCTTAEAGKNPTISGTCDEGENFDTFLGDCSPTAACETQCENVIGEDGCIEPFTCLTTGYFARCPGQCTPDYYHCTAATGEYQDVGSCAEGTVFHPDDHTCVAVDKCP